MYTERNLRYEVLSDAEKRSIYDSRGEAGLSESGGMGGMDPQVGQSITLTLGRLRIICFRHRIYSANYSEEEAASVVEAEDSSVEVVEGDHRDHERRKTSFIAFTSPSKIFTKAKPRNSHSHEMHFAQSAMVKAEKKVPSRRATIVVVVVSKSLCVRWDL